MRATWHGPARSHPAPSASVPAHPRPGGAREPHLGPFLSRATPPRFSVRRRSVRDTCRPTHQRCTERCIPLRCMRAGKSETSGQQIHLGGPVNYPPVPPAGTHAGRQQRDGVVAVVGRLNHPLEEPREQPRGVRGVAPDRCSGLHEVRPADQGRVPAALHGIRRPQPTAGHERRLRARCGVQPQVVHRHPLPDLRRRPPLRPVRPRLQALLPAAPARPHRLPAALPAVLPRPTRLRLRQRFPTPHAHTTPTHIRSFVPSTCASTEHTRPEPNP